MGVPQYWLSGFPWTPRAQPSLSSLRHPGSGQAPAWGSSVRRKVVKEALHHFGHLLSSWAGTRENVKAALCAWNSGATEALLTAELVASPELLWGLIPTAEMGRGFGFTSSVPGWPQGRHPECLIHLLRRRGFIAGGLTGSTGEGSLLLKLRWMFMFLKREGAQFLLGQKCWWFMLLGENVNNYKFPSYCPRKTESFYTFVLVCYNYNQYSEILLEKLLFFLKW